MRYILLTAVVLVGLASCKKAETAVTRQDELRMGNWKMVAGTIKMDPAIGADTLIHYYDSLPACKKDDYMVFLTNYDGTQNSGTKCDASEPDMVQFRWELYDNGEGISFWNANNTFFGKPAVSAPFVSYTSSRFTIRYVEYVINAINNTKRDTITYTHTFAKF